MFLGRDTPGKEERVRLAKEWVRARSPYTLTAGLLGIMAPIDGLIFFPLSILAIIIGILGLREIKHNPAQLGKKLCYLGIIGGTVGLMLAVTLHFIL